MDTMREQGAPFMGGVDAGGGRSDNGSVVTLTNVVKPRRGWYVYSA